MLNTSKSFSVQKCRNELESKILMSIVQVNYEELIFYNVQWVNSLIKEQSIYILDLLLITTAVSWKLWKKFCTQF